MGFSSGAIMLASSVLGAASPAEPPGTADWKVAAEAYIEAAESNAEISNPEDLAICAGLWEGWAELVRFGEVPPDPAKLGFSAVGADQAASAWLARTDLSKDALTTANFVRMQAVVDMDDILAGNADKTREYFRALGVCRPPLRQLEPHSEDVQVKP